MKKILVLLLLIIYPANAEIVTATGKYKHLGDKTKIQSCKIALERAKKNAIIQSSLGQTVSSEVISSILSIIYFISHKSFCPFMFD